MTDTYQIDTPDSVIITLEPDPESRSALAVQDGVPDAVPAKEYHLTLVRVGDISATSQLSDILQVLLEIATQHAPMTGDVSGAGFFGKDGFNGNTVMLVDIDGLSEFRTMLVEALAAAKVSVDESYDFIPHITVAKGPVIAPEAGVGTQLTFGNFGLRFGPQAAMVPFGLEPEPVVEEPVAAPESVPAAPAEGEAPVPAEGQPAPEGAVTASAGPNAEAVDRLMERLGAALAEFEAEPVRGDGGRFDGSKSTGGGDDDTESGGDTNTGGDSPADATAAFNSGDRAAEGAGPVVTDRDGAGGPDSPNAMEIYDELNAGLVVAAGGNDREMLDSLVALDAFSPTTGDTTVMMGTSARVNRETGEVAGDVNGSPDYMKVGAGDAREVLGENGSWPMSTPMEVSIPAGHPVVNLGSRADGTEALAKDDTYGYQSTMVMLHPSTELTVTGSTTDEVTGMPVVQVSASMPSEGTASASVEDAEELGFIQGPDGKFLGSEPEGGGDGGGDSGPVDGPEDPIGGGPADPLGSTGASSDVAGPSSPGAYPFADADKAGSLDPAGDWDNLDPSGDQQTVESVFLNGGEVVAAYTQVTEDGGMGMAPLEDMTEQGAESAYEMVTTQMDELATPATEEIAITTTASMGQYEYNPETGRLAGKYAEQDTLPIGATPPVIVGYGNPNAALGEAESTGDMAVQITVTPGTPIINGGVGQVADESAGTAVALPSSAKVTITGQAINPATGQPMLLATATAYEPGEARWR